MYIKQLETFLLVAQTGSFVGAARQLYLSQPAVTQQIQNLENEIGFPLFVRTKHDVSLTPAGERFLQGAQEIIAIYSRTVKEGQRIHSAAPDCVVHYVGNANLHLLPDVLRRFREQHPAYRVTTGRVRPDLAAAALANGSVRILLAPVDVAEGGGNVAFVDAFEARYYCVLNAEHPLARFSELQVAQLAGVPLLVPEPQYRFPHMEAVLEHIAQTLPGFAAVPTNGADDAFAQLLYGDCVAIMPGYIRPEHTNLVRIPLAIESTVRFGIIHTLELTPAEKKLIRFLQGCLQEQAESDTGF